jgi:rubrerythrin
VATGEYEAAQTYIQLAESIDNKLAAKVFKSVADIKRDQMGDFLRLPYEGTNLYAKGAKEREESNQDNAA